MLGSNPDAGAPAVVRDVAERKQHERAEGYHRNAEGCEEDEKGCHETYQHEEGSCNKGEAWLLLDEVGIYQLCEYQRQDDYADYEGYY